MLDTWTRKMCCMFVSLGCNVTSDQTKMMQVLYTCGSKRPKSKSGWIQRGGGFVSLTIMVYYDFLVSDSLHICGLHLVGWGFVLLLLLFFQVNWNGIKLIRVNQEFFFVLFC